MTVDAAGSARDSGAALAERAEDNRGVPASPFFTVVVSVFNGAETLRQCIDSVSSQTWASKELIIIDGGSTDGTVEILRENASKIAFWLSEPDRGIYHAWNKALDRARGRWICFLGADDYLYSPDVLARLSPVLTGAYPAVRIVYGQVSVVNSQEKEINRIGESWDSARKRFSQIMCVPHTALMHHRSLFEVHGEFNESFRVAGDYELLLRELREHDALFVSNMIVAGMRHGGVSSDPSGSVLLLKEFRRAQRMHGSTHPGRYWVSAYIKADIRVALWRLLGTRIAPYVFDFGRLISGKRSYWTR
jgi:glycosyltransferase involved in cell wall biosynthesis